ncbi:MAG TPA: universal stress protein [Polyangia bacterium]|jgi:nucleotide-binding universal stress UspA family protein|nr:universal stress protein [Polyangia bacterium]
MITNDFEGPMRATPFQLLGRGWGTRLYSAQPANDGAGDETVDAPAAHAPLLHARRILVGVDFSPASESARRLAVGIARASGGTVDLVSVQDSYRQTFGSTPDDLIGGPDLVAAVIDDALVRRVALALAEGVPCGRTALLGAPGRQLAEHALRTEADLIVLGIGSEQASRFGRPWGRSAAEQILREGRWRGPVLLRQHS